MLEDEGCSALPRSRMLSLNRGGKLGFNPAETVLLMLLVRMFGTLSMVDTGSGPIQDLVIWKYFSSMDWVKYFARSPFLTKNWSPLNSKCFSSSRFHNSCHFREWSWPTCLTNTPWGTSHKGQFLWHQQKLHHKCSLWEILLSGLWRIQVSSEPLRSLRRLCGRQDLCCVISHAGTKCKVSRAWTRLVWCSSGRLWQNIMMQSPGRAKVVLFCTWRCTSTAHIVALCWDCKVSARFWVKEPLILNRSSDWHCLAYWDLLLSLTDFEKVAWSHTHSRSHNCFLTKYWFYFFANWTSAYPLLYSLSFIS